MLPISSKHKDSKLAKDQALSVYDFSSYIQYRQQVFSSQYEVDGDKENLLAMAFIFPTMYPRDL
jgi:hypothetical protein